MLDKYGDLLRFAGEKMLRFSYQHLEYLYLGLSIEQTGQQIKVHARPLGKAS